MKILSIGNSFSADSQVWAREIALFDGEDMYLGNLYIGGCSLERHMQNVKSGEPAYDYYRNNKLIGLSSIETAITDEEWDYITLQQASGFSGVYETFMPFIGELAAYARKKAPNAKLVINQTWAYEKTSTHPAFDTYNRSQKTMHERLSDAYRQAAASIGCDIIPVGESIRIARLNEQFDPEKGGIPLTRDGFHLSFTHGRFLAGAVWYEFFTGRDVRENRFVPYRMEYMGKNAETGADILRPVACFTPTDEQMRVLREAAHQAVNQ